MRKLVVCTSSGDVIKERDLEDHELVNFIGAWLYAMPECALYLDGELMPEEAVKVIRDAIEAQAKAAMSQPATPTTAPTAVPTAAPLMAPTTPEQIKDFADVLRLIFDDVRKAHLQGLREIKEIADGVSHMIIEHTRLVTDESARQRALTQKSLGDVDLLARSVMAVRFEEATSITAQAASLRGRPQPRGSVGGWDVVVGLAKSIFGDT